MSPGHSLARLRALHPAERRLLLLALFLLPAYSAGLRLRGLRRARRWFRTLPAIAGATPAQAERMVALAVRRGPWRASCLPAALTLQRLLAAQGVEAELRLGVRKAGVSLEAHAWLEREGIPILDIGGGPGSFGALERAAAPSP